MPKPLLFVLQERPLSSDHFKTFGKCAKKYELQYLQRLNWPSDQRNFELGKSVHKLMEYQARKLPIDGILNFAPADIKAVWIKLDHHPVSQWPIIASEWAFSVPLELAISNTNTENENLSDFTPPDFTTTNSTTMNQSHRYWVSGRIDRVAWQAEAQTLWILDWKTGTAAPKKPETDWQTRIYLWAITQAYPQLRASLADEELLAALPETLKPHHVKFKYVEVSVKKLTAPVREYNVSFNSKKLAENEQQIRLQLKRLVFQTESQEFPLPEKCPDMYCPYHPVCGIAPDARSPYKEDEEVIV